MAAVRGRAPARDSRGPPGDYVPLAPSGQGSVNPGASRSYSAAVLDAAPDGIFIVDAQGKILLANRQAHILFGYAPA